MKTKGSVYKRKDQTWVAEVDTGKIGDQRSRRYKYASTRPKAYEKLKVVNEQLGNAASPAAMQMTVAAYLQKWFREFKKPKLRSASYAPIRNRIRPIVAHLGKHRLAELTPELVDIFQSRLDADGYSRHSRQQIHWTLKEALSTAVSPWGFLRENPALDYDGFKKMGQSEMMPLTLKQSIAFLRLARKTDRLWALYWLAIGTGLRYSELMGLRFEDYGATEKTLSIRRTRKRVPTEGIKETELKTKTSRRVLVLPDFAVEAIEEHRAQMIAEGFGDGGFMFVNQKGGMVDPSSLCRISFKPLLYRAGLPDIRLHDLRHTHCTQAFETGPVNPQVVAKRMGHADAAKMTLQVYMHVATDQDIDVAKRLDSFLRTMKIRADTHVRTIFM